MKILFSFIILSLGCAKSFAQLNESDTTNLQLLIGITANYQKGNVEVLNIRTKLDLSFSPHKNWVIKSQNSSLYQAFYGKKADNDIFSRNYIYYRPKDKIYPFAISYISSNYRREIELRLFTGAGFTWQAIRREKNFLKLSLCSIYETTKFTGSTFNFPAYIGKNNISLWRGTFYLSGSNNLFDSHALIFYDMYWQPAYKNINNFRTQIDTGISFPVWKGLSFNALYIFTHENVVIEGIKQEDKILSFGIGYYLKIN